MARIKVTGGTRVSVKKSARKMVGGKGDPGFISGTIKAAVRKRKSSNYAKH